MSVETFAWFGNDDEIVSNGMDGTSGVVGRRAVVLPGGWSSVESPPLFHVAQVLAGAGWFVQAVRWDYDEAAQSDPMNFVRAAAELALAAAPQAATTMVVGKSMGTRAAPWAVERHLPAIWLTPLLRDPAIVNAVRTSISPTLVVGGTDDPMWDAEVAASAAHDVSGLQVHEVVGGDHGLQIGRDWRLSMTALVGVLDAVETFARALG